MTEKGKARRATWWEISASYGRISSGNRRPFEVETEDDEEHEEDERLSAGDRQQRP